MSPTLESAAEPLQFKRIEDNERLFLKVVDEIGGRILGGSLRPGDMLPPERIMAEQFGVSRTVIREAVKALELQGLIEVQHGRGALVVRPSPSSVADPLARFVKIQESPIWALFELRSILEVEIAGLAAQRRNDTDLQALAGALEQMAARVDTPGKYVEYDLQFHRGIWQAAHNQLFEVVLEPFMALMRESRRLGANAPHAPTRSIVLHRQLYEAIRAQDAESPRRVMVEHFEQVAVFYQEVGAEAGS